MLDKDVDILSLYDITSQILPDNLYLLDLVFQYALGAVMNYVQYLFQSEFKKQGHDEYGV